MIKAFRLYQSQMDIRYYMLLYTLREAGSCYYYMTELLPATSSENIRLQIKVHVYV